MRPRTADNDPVYSPEDSDTDPHGDWQTKVGVVIATIFVTAVLGGGFAFWFFWHATFR